MFFTELAEETERFVSTGVLFPADIKETIEVVADVLMTLSLYKSADWISLVNELKELVRNDAIDRKIQELEGIRVDTEAALRELGRSNGVLEQGQATSDETDES